MYVTYKSLGKINFPIYLLSSDNISYVDGLVFVDSLVVDDRNMSGNTLGIRRLQSPIPLKKLHPLKKSLKDPVALVKMPGNKSYIDTSGTIFTYQKTLFTTVHSKRIKKVVIKEGVGSVLHICGESETFILARPPEDKYSWASIIYVGKFPWLVYGFSEEQEKSRKLKI